MPVATFDYPILGDGTASSAGPYGVGFTHGLGTLTPLVELFERTSAGDWRLVSAASYAFTSNGVNNARIDLAHTPPLQGYTGAVRLRLSHVAAPVAVVPGNGELNAGASQLADFRTAMQAGQGLSLQSLFGVVIVFESAPGIVMGDEDGYEASAGPAISDAQLAAVGILEGQLDRVFRVFKATLDADAIVLVEHKTRILCEGRAYRLERIAQSPADPAIRLACKVA